MAIKSIYLSNFRNHISLTLDLASEKQSVVIEGENGAGKTSLLEAVYLAVTAKSFLNAKSTDISNYQVQNEGWFVKAEIGLKNNNNATLIHSFVNSKRSINLDGKSVHATNISKLISAVAIFPSVFYFLRSKSYRRDYFDELVAKIFPSLKQYITNYHKLLYERQQALKLSSNSTLLDVLEKQIAANGISILAFRTEFVDRINSIDNVDSNVGSNHTDDNFLISYQGEISGYMSKHMLSKAENYFADRLKANRKLDLYKGRTSVGIHLSDINIFVQNKDMVKFSSSGEFKDVLLKFYEKFILLHQQIRDTEFIVILDEITSYLDTKHRQKWIEFFAQMKTQVWMSALTDLNLTGIHHVHLGT